MAINMGHGNQFLGELTNVIEPLFPGGEEEEEDDNENDNDNDNDGLGPNNGIATETDTNTNTADDEDDGNGFSDDGVPLIAPYRLNLTTLSQRYNIYAAAYRNTIHISRVRSCVDHSLPARPDLILRPPTSKEALTVGGFLDRNMPHQMNHLIIGDLGNEEILLLACDDGDVLAYYNSQIETALLRLESGDATRDSTMVRPFFHQNVGLSAWGLAVHKHSRLIAIGSNKHEVHVFAFALNSVMHEPPEGAPELPCTRDLFVQLSHQGGAITVRGSSGTSADLDAFLSGRRDRGYQIILGPLGDHIPNVAFSDDAHGDAVKVLAIDIRGTLFIIDIWRSCSFEAIPSIYTGYQAAHYISNRHIPNSLPRGWGVLVLPQSSFLPTSTFKDSLGLCPEEAVYATSEYYGYYIGTGRAVKNIKNNSTRHPWVRNNVNLFRLAPHWHGFNVCRDWYDSKTDHNEQWNATRDKDADDGLEDVHPEIAANPRLLLPDGSSVMRTYETDIEFVAGDLNIGIMFKDATRQKQPQRTILPHVAFPPERLANLIHVPELSLVVAGSQCGRVALITLTRPENPSYSFKRGFKVEFILPKTIDEDRRIRPMCLLLGVAVGPICSAGDADDHSLGNRRYRIMLHYYNHRILSYEVYRNVITNDLSVV
ncbi:hypothetical protein F5Y09DRAFT_168449 [Xylaria sp. FL1042]|nr:hypothetical protein F5Y09DRAFT_168449 [Xylaria sp. FL1042]